jgi:hypothetical protein
MGSVELKAVELSLIAALAAEFGPLTDLVLVRVGSNVTFRSVKKQLFIRVTTGGDSAEELRRGLVKARELFAAGAPVVPPLSSHVFNLGAGAYATLWPLHRAVEPTPAEMGRLIRSTRDISALTSLKRGKEIIDRVQPRLLFAADAGVPDSLVDFLSGELKNLEQCAVAHSPAGTAIHGDAHKGNVVSTEKGLRWVDLDTFALGDPEVDLAPARVASQRFRVSAGDWEEFLGGYSRPFDEERLEYYSRLKQLTMTSWLATLWRIRPETRPELLHRIETFREEAEWHAM